MANHQTPEVRRAQILEAAQKAGACDFSGIYHGNARIIVGELVRECFMHRPYRLSQQIKRQFDKYILQDYFRRHGDN